MESVATSGALQQQRDIPSLRLYGNPFLIACFFVTVVFLGFALHRIDDPDLWWHLRTGQLIVETQSIPSRDPFSFTAAGQPWVNHEWLTQVIVYMLYRSFGFSGILLFTGIVSTATLALFYVLLCRIAQSAWLAFLITFASVLAFRGFQPDRPLWFSYLLLMVVLLAIETSRTAAKPSRLFYGLPLVMVLWANLHSGVVLGLAVLGAHWFVAEVSRFSHPLYSAPQLRHFRLVVGAAAIASLLNPYGYHIYALVFTHLTSPLPRMTIAEWLPPELGALYFKAVLGGTLWLLIAVLGLSQHRVEADRLIWLLGAAALALTSRRHLPLLVFFGAITIAPHVAALVTEYRRRSSPDVHVSRLGLARTGSAACPKVTFNWRNDWNGIPSRGTPSFALTNSATICPCSRDGVFSSGTERAHCR